ncbi:MAG: hypothetical protein HY908_20435 [Myxococcales bacterium]|nr:hypothetical protein [Myxococcales bacterium]
MRSYLLISAAVLLASAIGCEDKNKADPNYPGSGAYAGYPGSGAYAGYPGSGAYAGYPGTGATAGYAGAAGYPGTAGYGGAAGYPGTGGMAGAAGAAGAPASGGSATPIAPMVAGVLQPAVTGLAMKDLPGMQPEGGAFAGQFGAGQTLEQPFTLQPGKCYGVIGVGMGITELDVQIVIQQAPLPPYTAAQDSTTGPQATLGAGGQCFKNPLPIGAPAKVIMRATAGQGMALGQIFVK